MPPFAKKKVYANRCIKEITMKLQVLAPAPQITIIMIILIVPTIMQIQSMIPASWVE